MERPKTSQEFIEGRKNYLSELEAELEMIERRREYIFNEALKINAEIRYLEGEDVSLPPAA